jgi:hypothetical protein
MNVSPTPDQALHAIAVIAGVLAYCSRRETYYADSEPPEAAVPYNDRHLAEVRQYFASLVAIYVALRHSRSAVLDPLLPRCTGAVGFV